jgi:rod shape determining protein RodA
MLISVVSIYSGSTLDGNRTYYLKQMMWYGIGIVLILLIMKIGMHFFIRYCFYFYVFGNVMLLLLLLFARPINDARCWFELKGIGTVQPSEFMKIILILTLSKVIYTFKEKYPNPSVKIEFFFLLKVGIIVFIPSILTFLQPDTGIVLIYLLITIIMLFAAGIRKRWFFILFSFCGLGVGTILGIYFLNEDLFTHIFGSSLFLRIDRLLDWSNKSGFQLEHGLYSIGSAGLVGHGFLNTPLYFPEAQTDFIFAVFASNFGFLGSFFLLGSILFFDLKLIGTALKSENSLYKYLISGIIGMLIYQQFQNIGMTVGILPITGITLPFISYGGSSLLSYMLMLGFVFRIAFKNDRKYN